MIICVCFNDYRPTLKYNIKKGKNKEGKNCFYVLFVLFYVYYVLKLRYVLFYWKKNA